MTSARFLEVQGLSKRFAEAPVLDGISLAVEEGEVLALLGPSGSGKTTFLRLLAGFETADGGSIRVAGREVTALAPAARAFGMVFQHYALFPHLTVAENVAFGLESAGAARGRRAEIAERVAEVLALVDLTGFGDRLPGALSGGQQQRVAVARALAPHPRLLLLDEPLSNLDPSLRERTRRELLGALRRVGITTVLVTHEQDEAFYLGDRVAVLWEGRLQQVGTPEELYQRPANRFVATFVGRSTVFRGRLVAHREGDRVAVALAGLAGGGAGGPVWEAVGPPGSAATLAPGAAVDLVVRPEALALVPLEEERQDALAGTVAERRYQGPVTYYRVALDGGDPTSALAAAAGDASPPERPAEVEVLAGPGDPAAAAGDRVRLAPGDRVRLAPLGSPGAPVPRAFRAGSGEAGR